MTGKLEYIFDAWKLIRNYLLRNRIILNDIHRRTTPNEINLHWFAYSDSKQNIGDMLSPVITDWCMKQHNLQRCGKGRKHLYAIGSIIDGGYQNATIWGSGVLFGRRKWWWKHLRKLDIRSVRGPESREALLFNGYDCPELYSDPAILMPLVYPARPNPLIDYLVIRHFTWGGENQDGLSPITNDWKDFIDKLMTARIIISSSLHGIILAESYGIPAILLSEDGLNLFKYRGLLRFHWQV